MKEKSTIVLVDDERNILASLGLALEAEGYKVRTYSDGAAALEALAEEMADLAILDIKMPRMDGVEVLRPGVAISRGAYFYAKDVALRLPDVGVVAGAIDEANRPPDTASATGAYEPWTATPSRGFGKQGEGDTDHAPGGNFSCWRRAIMAAGGVDEALNVGAALYEETELCLRVKRAGFRVYFNGRARLTHLAAADGGGGSNVIRSYFSVLRSNSWRPSRKRISIRGSWLAL